MRSRRKTVLLAFLAALIAAFFAMPIIKGHQCANAGGTWHRDTLTCEAPR
jgi:hypothetical protein